MTIIEITDFTHVIAIAFQRRLQAGETNPLLTFGDIWWACDAAKLPRAGGPMPWSNDPRKDFVRRMFEAVQSLEDDGYAWRLNGGPPDKRTLQHVGLTASGRTLLCNVVFAHQDRAPDTSKDLSHG